MAFPDTALPNQWLDLEELNAFKMNARVDAMLNALAARTVGPAPIGSIAHNVLGSNTNFTATPGAAASVSANFVSGRKYAIAAYFQGSQNTGAGIAQVALAGTGIPTNLLYFQSTGPATIYGSTVAYFPAAATGAVTVSLNASTTANSLTVTAGAYIWVIDMGTA